MVSFPDVKHTRILLADDHRMILEGLRAILEQAGAAVVGEAFTGREALEAARRLRPDIVVMDIGMPDLNGIDATRQLRAEMPEVEVIGLSMSADRRYVTAMLSAGAAGYVLKNEASDALLLAVDAVLRGLTFVSSSIAESSNAPRVPTPGSLAYAP